jgi:hypothetical protein
VRLLALLRMQVVQQDVMDALTKLFLKVLLPALGTLLKAVF